MSCDYHLTCATCDPTGACGPGHGNDLNHCGDVLLELIPKLSAIAAFYRATGFDIDPESLDFRLSRIHGLGAWAAQHDGHDLRVRDEYGRWYPETPELAERHAGCEGRDHVAVLRH